MNKIKKKKRQKKIVRGFDVGVDATVLILGG